MSRAMLLCCFGPELAAVAAVVDGFVPDVLSDVVAAFLCDPLDSFRAACGDGQLGRAMWLACAFALTAADARADENGALRDACEGGHIAVATWLAERFALTAADARACENWPLRYAC